MVSWRSRSVHLDLPWWYCKGVTSRNLLSTATSDCGWTPQFLNETSFQSCCKMWISSLGLVYGSRVTVLHDIFFLHFGILEPSSHRCNLCLSRWSHATISALYGQDTEWDLSSSQWSCWRYSSSLSFIGPAPYYRDWSATVSGYLATLISHACILILTEEFAIDLDSAGASRSRLACDQ